MTNTLLRSQKDIPDHIVEILRLVFSEANKNGIQAFLVGAASRDLIFEYVYEAGIKRATEDIDFGVAVGSWEEYQNLKNLLVETRKFKLDNKAEQRIRWKDGSDEMKVDLVPYGNIESPKGQIAFPPNGDFVMSTIGFAEAFENSWELEIDDDFTIRIASLAGLALLKFIAYNDNPANRRRDVQDIWFIAESYLKAANEERLYEQDADADLLDEDDFDLRICGARLLGRDIAPLLNEESFAILIKLLSDGKLEKLADVIISERLNERFDYNLILTKLKAIKRGIDDRRIT